MDAAPDPPDWSTVPESLRLLALIWGLSAALERTSRGMKDHLGVTGPQRFLLRFVGLAPGITCARLANVVSLDLADLQSDLDDLLAGNLLAQPEGSAGYYLTSRGATVNAAMESTVEEAVSKALDEAMPYERTAFQKMLNRVVSHLKPPAA
jgi:hypothetical protein